MIIIVFLILLVIVIYLLASVVNDIRVKAYIKRLQICSEISRGMSEEEVVNILGKRFKKSLLKDGRTQLTYSVYRKKKLVRHVDIYLMGDSVNEVDASNL